ncbi:MAG: tol-pal system protein YbgF [Mariprofundaceae bacterium]
MKIAAKIFVFIWVFPLIFSACANQAHHKRGAPVWKDTVEQRLGSLESRSRVVPDIDHQLSKLRAKLAILEAENERDSQESVRLMEMMFHQVNNLEQELDSLRVELTRMGQQRKGKEKTKISSKKDSQKATKHKKTGTDQLGEKKRLKLKMDKFQQEKAKQAYNDAYFALKKGNYIEASLAFQNFIRDYPQNKLIHEARYWYGESLLAEGDTSSSIKVFQSISKLNSKVARHADAMFKLGLIYEDKGRVKEATAVYNALIQKHPSNTRSEAAREKLKAMKK